MIVKTTNICYNKIGDDMGIFEYALFIIVIVCLLAIGYISMYNIYQISIIRINEAEANIDSTLRKRFDLLSKSINIIKNNTDEKEVLENINKLRSKKLNNFEFDRELISLMNEFYEYTGKYPDLKSNEQYMNINFGLAETESEIVAFRKYYNDIITDYNKLVKSFPTNIVALFSRYKTKTYFDGKNQETNDEIKI